MSVIDLLDAARELQDFCDNNGWRSCLIGGIAVQRSTLFEFAPGLNLRTCSAEDLMVMKLFASRAIDIRDAEGIAVRHRNSLDWRYIEDQLTPLAEAKEEPAILSELARLRRLV